MRADPIKVTTGIVTVTAALVILAAGILGFSALRDLFVSIGLFAAWLGLLFPLLFDLAEVAAAVAVLNAKLQGEDDKFAWNMVILFTGLGIVANIAHALHAWWLARIDTSQAILAVIFTSLFPLSVALVTHLLKKVIARHIDRSNKMQTWQELETELQKLDATIASKNAELARVEASVEAAKTSKTVDFADEMHIKKQARIVQRRELVAELLQQGLDENAILKRVDVKDVRTVRRDIAAISKNGNGRMS